MSLCVCVCVCVCDQSKFGGGEQGSLFKGPLSWLVEIVTLSKSLYCQTAWLAEFLFRMCQLYCGCHSLYAYKALLHIQYTSWQNSALSSNSVCRIHLTVLVSRGQKTWAVWPPNPESFSASQWWEGERKEIVSGWKRGKKAKTPLLKKKKKKKKSCLLSNGQRI